MSQVSRVEQIAHQTITVDLGVSDKMVYPDISLECAACSFCFIIEEFHVKDTYPNDFDCPNCGSNIFLIFLRGDKNEE